MFGKYENIWQVVGFQSSGTVEVRDIANQSEDSYIIIPPKLDAELSSSQKTKANGEGRRYQTETGDVYQLDLMSVVAFLFGEDHDVVGMTNKFKAPPSFEGRRGRLVGVT
ncbi:hypothetical protein MMC29_000552 [Sticta canariensis]|nr:hypothetical protein [Sticta canariensis]